MKYLALVLVLAAVPAGAQTIPGPVGGIVPTVVPNSVAGFPGQLDSTSRTAGDSLRLAGGDTANIPIFSKLDGNTVKLLGNGSAIIFSIRPNQ